MTHAFSCALQHEKDGTQVDRQHTVPVVLGDIEQLPDFSDPSVVEQHVKASPALVRQIEHTLDVLCMGNVRLHRSLPKLVGKALCAVTILVRQQQLRPIACHASSARSANATRSARDERMNTVQPTSHMTCLPRSRGLRRTISNSRGPVRGVWWALCNRSAGLRSLVAKGGDPEDARTQSPWSGDSPTKHLWKFGAAR